MSTEVVVRTLESCAESDRIHTTLPRMKHFTIPSLTSLAYVDNTANTLGQKRRHECRRCRQECPRHGLLQQLAQHWNWHGAFFERGVVEGREIESCAFALFVFFAQAQPAAPSDEIGGQLAG